MRTLVWFRGKDLRISDHAPLDYASKHGEMIPVFVLDPYFFAPERARELPHRMQFLLDSLSALYSNIKALGSQLLVVPGKSVDVIPKLADQLNADRVVAQRWVEPFGRERDDRIAKALGNRFKLFEGETLIPPGTLRTQDGKPYKVFSQFARSFRATAQIASAIPKPESLPAIPTNIDLATIPIPNCESLGIKPNPALLKGGERAALNRLRRFSQTAALDYAELRNRMDIDGTSRLSADLKFGTVSIRRVWQTIDIKLGDSESGQSFLNELIWREFTHSTLWDKPDVLNRPFRDDFSDFPWQHDDPSWQAWVNGKTGYPLVDAAARQLTGEGFVHNRARMVAASFLTKHLLIDYRLGEAHYMKYLTDGDWAQNNAGWQWSAGCGCDAQPYFRILNPVTQGKKFDPDGDYVRRWVPELSNLPSNAIHAPWGLPEEQLRKYDVELGTTYPYPIIEHKFARQRFLDLTAAHLKTR